MSCINYSKTLSEAPVLAVKDIEKGVERDVRPMIGIIMSIVFGLIGSRKQRKDSVCEDGAGNAYT